MREFLIIIHRKLIKQGQLTLLLYKIVDVTSRCQMAPAPKARAFHVLRTRDSNETHNASKN